jgi:hypothetical protein
MSNVHSLLQNIEQFFVKTFDEKFQIMCDWSDEQRRGYILKINTLADEGEAKRMVSWMRERPVWESFIKLNPEVINQLKGHDRREEYLRNCARLLACQDRIKIAQKDALAPSTNPETRMRLVMEIDSLALQIDEIYETNDDILQNVVRTKKASDDNRIKGLAASGGTVPIRPTVPAKTDIFNCLPQKGKPYTLNLPKVKSSGERHDQEDTITSDSTKAPDLKRGKEGKKIEQA